MFLLGLLIVFIVDAKNLKCNAQNLVNVSKEIGNISNYNLPYELELCGEKIPLDDPDVLERAEREFFLLLQQPGQIILYMKRAGKYFPIYETILAEYGLPNDLKFLSVAESALYQATSAKSAVGLWQFMPGTAKNFGLIVNDFVDERRNPEKSTRAACQYLKAGYKRHNSWLLALAGYNMGDGGIAGQMSYQYGNDYFDLYLNDETSRFIFRIAIIKEIMTHPENYGFNTSTIKKYSPERVKKIKVDSAIKNLSDWAIGNGTNYKSVKRLNPWILKKELPSPREYWEIEIPSSN